MKMWEFDITLVGTGETSEEAWHDAVEGFELDPGCEPENPRQIEDDSDDIGDHEIDKAIDFQE